GGGAGGTGGGSARFFGVEATGNRFAYIVDTSGSMLGERIDTLKDQLISTVVGLPETAHFFAVEFNSVSKPIGAAKWMPATGRAKAEFRRAAQGLDGSGGTSPLPAFEIVFALRPRPDAIYFMTDGVFSGSEEEVAARIRRMNNSGARPVPIHCIAFMERGSETIMRKIAQQSGGTYTFVPSPSEIRP
ncbi:MAG: VWA domain-containing protein, partial [Phycisphaerales bacterium]|nr:VWA domain-containing protein [Phycisphaerales bacterium]